MNSDEGCYRRYLNGDDSGLAELIDIYNEGLSLYLNSMVKNICEAEEIMQETFVKIAIRKPRFSGKCTFKTWLFTIARNCAVDFMRHHSRFTDGSIDECFEITDETEIEKQYLIEEQKIELHKALKKINPDYSQVLYLMYFEGFDTEEAARIMHRSKRQIGDLVYRAKMSLKSELEKDGFVYEEF